MASAPAAPAVSISLYPSCTSQLWLTPASAITYAGCPIPTVRPAISNELFIGSSTTTPQRHGEHRGTEMKSTES